MLPRLQTLSLNTSDGTYENELPEYLERPVELLSEYVKGTLKPDITDFQPEHDPEPVETAFTEESRPLARSRQTPDEPIFEHGMDIPSFIQKLIGEEREVGRLYYGYDKNWNKLGDRKTYEEIGRELDISTAEAGRIAVSATAKIAIVVRLSERLGPPRAASKWRTFKRRPLPKELYMGRPASLRPDRMLDQMLPETVEGWRNRVTDLIVVDEQQMDRIFAAYPPTDLGRPQKLLPALQEVFCRNKACRHGLRVGEPTHPREECLRARVKRKRGTTFMCAACRLEKELAYIARWLSPEEIKMLRTSGLSRFQIFKLARAWGKSREHGEKVKYWLGPTEPASVRARLLKILVNAEKNAPEPLEEMEE